MTRTKLVVGSLIGAVAIHAAFIACSTVIGHPDGGQPDAGSDVIARDDPQTPDVQTTPDVTTGLDANDDGVPDVAQIDVRETSTDSGFLDVIGDIADRVLDAEIGDVMAQDSSMCTCQAPAPDVTTFSIASLTEMGTTAQPLRADYSVATATFAPALVNNVPALRFSFYVSAYGQDGRLFTITCSNLLTNSSGTPTAMSGGMCTFSVTTANGSGLSTTTFPSPTGFDVSNLSDTGADVHFAALSSNGSTTRFNLTDLRVHVVRPRGGVTVPGQALTP